MEEQERKRLFWTTTTLRSAKSAVPKSCQRNLIFTRPAKWVPHFNLFIPPLDEIKTLFVKRLPRVSRFSIAFPPTIHSNNTTGSYAFPDDIVNFIILWLQHLLGGCISFCDHASLGPSLGTWSEASKLKLLDSLQTSLNERYTPIDVVPRIEMNKKTERRFDWTLKQIGSKPDRLRFRIKPTKSLQILCVEGLKLCEVLTEIMCPRVLTKFD